MSNKRISQLDPVLVPNNSDVFAIVNSGETKKISYGSLSNALYTNQGNSDTLGGNIVRTLYTRTNEITRSTGEIDFLSGSLESAFGSREIPSTFFANASEYKSKIIHFRVFGAFSNSDNDTTFNSFLKIGNNKITSSDIGNISLTQPKGHPFEISGEIIFNNDTVRTCYSLGHCAQNGDYKRYPLSDATQVQSINSFTGGDFKLLIASGSNVTLTTYGGYVQVYN
jgi:hypothetical protein